MFRYCGSKVPPVLTSLGNRLTIVYKTDHLGALDGFMLNYTSLNKVQGTFSSKYISHIINGLYLCSMWWKLLHLRRFYYVTKFPRRLSQPNGLYMDHKCTSFKSDWIEHHSIFSRKKFWVWTWFSWNSVCI